MLFIINSELLLEREREVRRKKGISGSGKMIRVEKNQKVLEINTTNFVGWMVSTCYEHVRHTKIYSIERTLDRRDNYYLLLPL